MKIRKNAKKIFRVLSCVIYTIIRNYVCIDYLGSEKKIKWFTSWCWWELQTSWQKIWQRIGIRNYRSANEFVVLSRILKNDDYVVILKCTNRMYEYYFNKGFIIFDCDEKKLKRLPSQVKDRVGAEVTINS